MRKILRFAALLLIVLLLGTMASAVEIRTSGLADLENGSTGEMVVQLQERLYELGFYMLTADGIYGNGTINAVKAFQIYNGLEPDGLATIQLQLLIFSDEAKGIRTPEATTPAFAYDTDFVLAEGIYVANTDFAAGVYNISALTQSTVLIFEDEQSTQAASAYLLQEGATLNDCTLDKHMKLQIRDGSVRMILSEKEEVNP